MTVIIDTIGKEFYVDTKAVYSCPDRLRPRWVYPRPHELAYSGKREKVINIYTHKSEANFVSINVVYHHVHDGEKRDLGGDAEVDLQPLRGCFVLGTPAALLAVVESGVALVTTIVPVGGSGRAGWDLPISDVAVYHPQRTAMTTLYTMSYDNHHSSAWK